MQDKLLMKLKTFIDCLKSDPAWGLFLAFCFFCMVSPLVAQIALTLSVIFAFCHKSIRHRLRITWPTWGWIVYMVVAFVTTALVLRTQKDELLHPRIAKIIEHGIWYIAIPIASANITSRERLHSAVRSIAIGGLILACAVLIRNSSQAMFRFYYPNPGEIKVLESTGLNATNDHSATEMIVVRRPEESGGTVLCDASGNPANKIAKAIFGMLTKLEIDSKCTAWVFSVKSKKNFDRYFLNKNNQPSIHRTRKVFRSPYFWMDKDFNAYHIIKSDLYNNVYGIDKYGNSCGGNRPDSLRKTLEAIGDHGDSQRLMIAFLATLILLPLNLKSQNIRHNKLKAILPLAVVFCATCVTFKEGAIISSLIFAIIFSLSFCLRNWHKYTLLFVLAIGIIPFLFSLPCTWKVLDNHKCVKILAQSEDGNRLTMWRYVVPGIHKKYPMGTGFKAFTENTMRQFHKQVEPRKHVHCTPLQAFVDFGHLGFTIWLAWMLSGLLSSLRLLRIAKNENSDFAQTAKYPFISLCALILVGFIEYNLFSGDVVPLYAIAMGLACPFFSADKIRQQT